MSRDVQTRVEKVKTVRGKDSENAGDKPMLWALHADTQRMVHISYLERAQTGLGCNCICYSCSTSLEAVNAGRDANYFLQPNARGQFFRQVNTNAMGDGHHLQFWPAGWSGTDQHPRGIGEDG